MLQDASEESKTAPSSYGASASSRKEREEGSAKGALFSRPSLKSSTPTKIGVEAPVNGVTSNVDKPVIFSRDHTDNRQTASAGDTEHAASWVDKNSQPEQLRVTGGPASTTAEHTAPDLTYSSSRRQPMIYGAPTAPRKRAQKGSSGGCTGTDPSCLGESRDCVTECAGCLWDCFKCIVLQEDQGGSGGGGGGDGGGS